MLSKDPDVFAAAVAGLNGHGDFLALLALHPADFEIAVAVVNEQQRVIAQRRKADMDYLAALLGRR